jgi:acylphosphatase
MSAGHENTNPSVFPITLNHRLKSMVRHYLVKGRVQGVGFRWLVHQEAGTRGLKGWVRNTEGGEVEIMVAGSEEKLAELRSVLQRGSRGSRVDAVQERDMDEAMADGLESFRIEGAW